MWASKATMARIYVNTRSTLGKINEKIAITATGSNIHGNSSHLVLLICETIKRHCKILKNISFHHRNDSVLVI